jgi:cytochrome c-type biogenesis protein CcmE
MTKKNLQFGAAIVIVLATLAWLAVSGVQESKTYYFTIKELQAMKDQDRAKRLRVGGNVVAGSIKKEGRRVEFRLVEEERTIPVVYTGSAPLPDTFVDNSQALVEGRLNRDGVFEANQIQAKCASKYEAKPGQPGGQPGKMAPAKPASTT